MDIISEYQANDYKNPGKTKNHKINIGWFHNFPSLSFKFRCRHITNDAKLYINYNLDLKRVICLFLLLTSLQENCAEFRELKREFCHLLSKPATTTWDLFS
jgi:hypothetical protein